jgi:hypothetical protein
MPKRRLKTNHRLQDRDYEILQHVFTYRASTRDVLHRLFFSDSDPNAVTKVTTRLIEGRFLQRFPLPGNSAYFRLGSAGSRIVGGMRKCVEPLGVQALYTNLAILGFCFDQHTNRRRMTVSEIQKELPQLIQKQTEPSQYVLDAADGQFRLTFVRVDGGGTSDHVVRKIRDDIQRRLPNAMIASLIHMRQFSISCVTYSDTKKEDIERRLQREEFVCDVEVQVVPQLSSILGTFYDE